MKWMVTSVCAALASAVLFTVGSFAVADETCCRQACMTWVSVPDTGVKAPQPAKKCCAQKCETKSAQAVFTVQAHAGQAFQAEQQSGRMSFIVQGQPIPEAACQEEGKKANAESACPVQQMIKVIKIETSNQVAADEKSAEATCPSKCESNAKAVVIRFAPEQEQTGDAIAWSAQGEAVAWSPQEEARVCTEQSSRMIHLSGESAQPRHAMITVKADKPVEKATCPANCCAADKTTCPVDCTNAAKYFANVAHGAACPCKSEKTCPVACKDSGCSKDCAAAANGQAIVAVPLPGQPKAFTRKQDAPVSPAASSCPLQQCPEKSQAMQWMAKFATACPALREQCPHIAAQVWSPGMLLPPHPPTAGVPSHVMGLEIECARLQARQEIMEEAFAMHRELTEAHQREKEEWVEAIVEMNAERIAELAEAHTEIARLQAQLESAHQQQEMIAQLMEARVENAKLHAMITEARTQQVSVPQASVNPHLVHLEGLTQKLERAERENAELKARVANLEAKLEAPKR